MREWKDPMGDLARAWRQAPLDYEALLEDANLKIRYFRESADRDLDMAFAADPLGDTWMPHWRLIEQCECHPTEHHRVECAATPVMASVYADMGLPAIPWPMEVWHDLRWLCYGNTEGDAFHVGGIINFPHGGHWCSVLGRWTEDWGR